MKINIIPRYSFALSICIALIFIQVKLGVDFHPGETECWFSSRWNWVLIFIQVKLSVDFHPRETGRWFSSRWNWVLIFIHVKLSVDFQPDETEWCNVFSLVFLWILGNWRCKCSSEIDFFLILQRHTVCKTDLVDLQTCLNESIVLNQIKPNRFVYVWSRLSETSFILICLIVS